MNPNTTEVKQEPKIEQAQIPNAQANVNPQTSPKEEAPQIKSEENQANWKAFREQREAERKAKAEAEKRAEEKQAEAEALKAALEALTNKPSNDHQMRNSSSEYIEETEEQKIDRLVESKIKQREEKLQQERLQREQQELPYKLKQSYPDIEQVMSQENVDYIEYHYPEVARSFAMMPNNFENNSIIYKAMKKLIPNTNVRKDEIKANVNMQKPGSVSSPVGNVPTPSGTNSARLTEERRQANWERMQRTLKGLT